MLFFQRFLYHLPYGHYVKIYFIFVASFLSGCKVTTFLPNVQEKIHFSYNFLVKSTHFSDKIPFVSAHFSDFLDVFGSVSVLGLSVGKKNSG